MKQETRPRKAVLVDHACKELQASAGLVCMLHAFARERSAKLRVQSNCQQDAAVWPGARLPALASCKSLQNLPSVDVTRLLRFQRLAA